MENESISVSLIKDPTLSSQTELSSAVSASDSDSGKVNLNQKSKKRKKKQQKTQESRRQVTFDKKKSKVVTYKPDEKLVDSSGSALEESGYESGGETPVPILKDPNSVCLGLIAARRVGSARHKAPRIGYSAPNSIKSDVLQKTQTLHSYTVLVDVTIHDKKVEALFDSGASSSIIDPRFLVSIPNLRDLEVLEYKYDYSCAAPGVKLPSQGAVTIPVQFSNNHKAPSTFVIADSDFPVVLGADFMFEHQVDLHFNRKGSYFKFPEVRGKIPLQVYPRLMAQWIRTKITECIQPGEEMAVAVRFVNHQGRNRPPPGTVGLLEPATQLREKNALVPYCALTTGNHSHISILNTGTEPLLLDAGTVIGCWVPATIVSQDLQNSFTRTIPETFDLQQSRFDQGYETDCDSDSETDCSDKDVTSPQPTSKTGPCVTSHVTLIHSEKRRRSSPPMQEMPSRLPPHLEKLLLNTDLTRPKDLKRLKHFLWQNRDVFAGPDDPLGHTKLIEHRIDTGDAKPIKQPPRRQAQANLDYVDQATEDMCQQGIARPSDSPWASPIVLVKKKDGSLRFCVDYRKLNEVTKRDAYPLPRIDDCFDCLGNSTWFCTLDLRSGYWQVPVAAEDVEKTAFVTHGGLYEYLVMPFGLTNAPATFERLMERVLRGLQWKRCLVYLDDIIIFGNGFERTIENLQAVLDRLREAGLTCSPKKCELFQKKVSFLGHVVSASGVECDPTKITAVSTWPVPENLKEVRGFLGLAGYYRRFIPHFSAHSAPLVELTKADRPFVWGQPQQQAFDTLKRLLCSPPVLAYPTREDVYVLDTDASDYGIGAVLSQLQNGEERVIAYGSKVLNEAQRHYCTTRKELYAVVYFVKHFHHYLAERRFRIRTDHASLIWLLNFKKPEGILARWLLTLSSYLPFDCIEHRAGRLHGNADALSRIPVDPSRKTKECPKTYVGCPTCRPGEDFDLLPDREYDVSLNVLRAQRQRQLARRTHRSKATPKDKEEEKSIATTSEKPSAGKPKDAKMPVFRPDFSQWTSGWTTHYLRLQQNQDVDIRTVKKRKKNHSSPPPNQIGRRESEALRTYWSQFDALVLVDDLLYRQARIPSKEGITLQLVLPMPLRELVLEKCHNNPLGGGHQGENNTFNHVRSRFYWSTYRRDTKLFVQACERCQRSKPRTIKKAPLTQYGAGSPLECIAMDLMGPFDPPTDQGNKYILVIGDYFTKWVEAIPLPNKEAETIAKPVVEFFCRYGIPERIHSDRGTEFHNQILGGICKLLEIHKSATTPYRPQSDGFVERFNRTLIKMLKSFVNDFANATTWDTLLPMLTAAYRATEHSSTGCTPNLLMLGRETNAPVDALAGAPPRQHSFYNASDYAKWKLRCMSKAHEYARNSLYKAATRQARNYNRNTKETWIPKPGDWVYLYHPPHLRYKLGSPWIGPYVVVKLLYNKRNVLVQAGPTAKAKVVHIDNLKPVMGRNQLQGNWIKEMIKNGTYHSVIDKIHESPESSEDETELETPDDVHEDIYEHKDSPKVPSPEDSDEGEDDYYSCSDEENTMSEATSSSSPRDDPLLDPRLLEFPRVILTPCDAPVENEKIPIDRPQEEPVPEPKQSDSLPEVVQHSLEDQSSSDRDSIDSDVESSGSTDNIVEHVPIPDPGSPKADDGLVELPIPVPENLDAQPDIDLTQDSFQDCVDDGVSTSTPVLDKHRPALDVPELSTIEQHPTEVSSETPDTAFSIDMLDDQTPTGLDDMTTPSFTLKDVTLPSMTLEDSEQSASVKPDNEAVPLSSDLEPDKSSSTVETPDGNQNGTQTEQPKEDLPEGPKASGSSPLSEPEEQPSLVLPRRSKRTKAPPDFLQVGSPEKMSKRKPTKKKPRKKPSSAR